MARACAPPDPEVGRAGVEVEVEGDARGADLDRHDILETAHVSTKHRTIASDMLTLERCADADRQRLAHEGMPDAGCSPFWMDSAGTSCSASLLCLLLTLTTTLLRFANPALRPVSKP